MRHAKQGDLRRAAAMENGLSRRDFLRTSAAVGASAALVPWTLGDAAAEAPKAGGTLVYGLETDPGVLDPHIFLPWATARVVMHIFDGLVTYVTPSGAAKPTISPQLAESWELSSDGTEYTFHLRRGVKFHDGTPFNAEAVILNMDRCRNPESPLYYPRAAAITRVALRWVKQVKAVDDFTVQFSLEQPFSDFLSYLADKQQTGAMISPTALRKYGNEGIAKHLVGAGPFEFVEQVPNERVIVKRFEDYWGKKPYVDRVIIRPLPDHAARLLALQTGEADVITIPPPDAKQQLMQQGFQWLEGDVHHVWMINLNLQGTYTKHKQVRQAIAYAIDKQGLAQYVLNGTTLPAVHGVTMPGAPSWDPEYVVYPHDPQKAKQLLAEAGFPDGFEMVFQTSTAGSGQLLPVKMMEFIQQNLKDVGISLKIEAYEWLTYVTMWAGGNKRPEVGGMQMSTGRPYDHWIGRVTHSANQPPNGWNQGWIDDPELDKIIDAATVQPDSTKAAALWRQAVRHASEQAYIIPIVHDLMPIALNPKVQGFRHPHLEWFRFDEVWLEA